ncbi:hypothetical protein T439DRAFT_330024 [Meredithblackwellia eburnea MCA 4105]
MSTTSSPLLGTAYIVSQSSHSPSTVQQTVITPSLCANLTQFKNVLRLSRSLDDSIILRLNRTAALQRQNGGLANAGECDAFWTELVERWSERGEVLGYCENVVDKKALEEVENKKGELSVILGLDRERKEVQQQMLGRGETESEMKRRMIQNETRVEEVIRARSLSFFLSRCPSHPQTPPPPPLPSVPDDGFVPRKRLL